MPPAVIPMVATSLRVIPSLSRDLSVITLRGTAEEKFAAPASELWLALSWWNAIALLIRMMASRVSLTV